MNVLLNFKIIICFLALSFQSLLANDKCDQFPFIQECDLCSCAASGGNAGFGTLGNTNFIGLRFNQQNFESINGIFYNSPRSNEYISSIQIWGQIPIYKNWSINVSLPYNQLTRESVEATEKLQGIGDASIINWYKIIILKKAPQEGEYYNNQKIPTNHSFQIGLGIKLPTGEYQERFANNFNPGFQVGTGSVDGIFAFKYNYNGTALGINTGVTYFLKGTNPNEFKFGNQTNINTNIYKVLGKEKKLQYIPFMGASADFNKNTIQYNEELANTDGHIVNGVLGTEIVYKKFILGANYATPIYQDLFDGFVESKGNIQVYLNFGL